MMNDRTVRLAFEGDLDVYRCDEFKSALPPPESIDRLIIDVRAARTVDSSIITTLMRYRRSFVQAGGDGHEIIVIVSPNLRRIFEITGLVNSLTVVSASAGVSLSESPQDA